MAVMQRHWLTMPDEELGEAICLSLEHLRIGTSQQESTSLLVKTYKLDVPSAMSITRIARSIIAKSEQSGGN